LTLPLVNFKPVLHRPIETAPDFGKLPVLTAPTREVTENPGFFNLGECAS